MILSFNFLKLFLTFGPGPRGQPGTVATYLSFSTLHDSGCMRHVWSANLFCVLSAVHATARVRWLQNWNSASVFLPLQVVNHWHIASNHAWYLITFWYYDMISLLSQVVILYFEFVVTFHYSELISHSTALVLLLLWYYLTQTLFFGRKITKFKLSVCIIHTIWLEHSLYRAFPFV